MSGEGKTVKIQTEKKKEKEKESDGTENRSKKKEVEMRTLETQTQVPQKTMTTAMQQTNNPPETIDSGNQMVPSMTKATVQTETTPISHIEMQTDIKERVTREVQTIEDEFDELEFKDFSIDEIKKRMKTGEYLDDNLILPKGESSLAAKIKKQLATKIYASTSSDNMDQSVDVFSGVSIEDLPMMINNVLQEPIVNTRDLEDSSNEEPSTTSKADSIEEPLSTEPEETEEEKSEIIENEEEEEEETLERTKFNFGDDDISRRIKEQLNKPIYSSSESSFISEGGEDLNTLKLEKSGFFTDNSEHTINELFKGKSKNEIIDNLLTSSLAKL